MKETGIVRPVDKLGRIVIPKELRRLLNVENEKDSFEIFVENDTLVLKKHKTGCVFCDSTENTFVHEGHTVCRNCAKDLLTKALLPEGTEIE